MIPTKIYPAVIRDFEISAYPSDTQTEYKKRLQIDVFYDEADPEVYMECFVTLKKVCGDTDPCAQLYQIFAEAEQWSDVFGERVGVTVSRDGYIRKIVRTKDTITEAELEELQANDKNISDSEKEAKQKCKEMKEDIVSRMNKLYREVDPQGRTFFDNIFTKRDETYSGSEEQEYYYSRVLAINDYFNHSYPLLIDCYRSGEISSQKEDIMIKNFISRKKQVIITSTLKKEEYTANKYDQYKGNANVIDYSNNESSKLLQSQYVARLGTIVESFGVIFTEE